MIELVERIGGDRHLRPQSARRAITTGKELRHRGGDRGRHSVLEAKDAMFPRRCDRLVEPRDQFFGGLDCFAPTDQQ